MSTATLDNSTLSLTFPQTCLLWRLLRGKLKTIEHNGAPALVLTSEPNRRQVLDVDKRVVWISRGKRKPTRKNTDAKPAQGAFDGYLTLGVTRLVGGRTVVSLVKAQAVPELGENDAESVVVDTPLLPYTPTTPVPCPFTADNAWRYYAWNYDLMFIPNLARNSRAKTELGQQRAVESFREHCAARKEQMLEGEHLLRQAGLGKHSDSYGGAPDRRDRCPRCGGTYWTGRPLRCHDCQWLLRTTAPSEVTMAMTVPRLYCAIADVQKARMTKKHLTLFFRTRQHLSFGEELIGSRY